MQITSLVVIGGSCCCNVAVVLVRATMTIQARCNRVAVAMFMLMVLEVDGVCL